mmetsp:Transcript_34620/g.62776  ORF Transcript_34620/g.62776 Transcript_34620/m.62776 type:complete len:728 (-) Transcript_34620:116-2299(-)
MLPAAEHKDEGRSLLRGKPAGKIEILGTEMVANDRPWHFVFVLPVQTAESSSRFAEEVPDPKAAWSRIFTGFENTGKSDALKSSMTRKEFNHAVFQEVVQIFAGPLCGFNLDELVSIDEDEMFLLLSLQNDEAIGELGEAEEFRAKLDAKKYPPGIEVATDTLAGKGGFEFIRHGDLTESHEHTNEYPGHVRYALNKQSVVHGFTSVELMRLMRRRMRKFIQLNGLTSEKVIRECFFVHRWDDLEVLYKNRRWNDPWHFFQWPAEHMSDLVHHYFGPEIGFYFHWFNCWTRFVLQPALISIPLLFIPQEVRWKAELGFAVFVALWSTLFLCEYEKLKNLKILKWGMHNYDEAGAEVRRQFNEARRNSCGEWLRKALHWSLCVLFMAETLGVVAAISIMRMKAIRDPDGVTSGIRHEDWERYGKYLIALNIKVVNFVWTPLTTTLTSMENWRTRADLKSAMVEKLFSVKFVVFYYPFLNTIMIKPYVSGCGDEGIAGCKEILQTDLLFFFIIQFASQVFSLIFEMAQAWWRVRREKRRLSDSSKAYTYLEFQAKCDEFDDAALIQQFEDQVLIFGFIVMFGVIFPVLCAVTLIFNLAYKRIFAYKLSYALRRPDPAGAEGIGSWKGILAMLSWIGVSFNAYLAVFCGPLFDDYSDSQRLIIFIAVEHVIFILKVVVEHAAGGKSTEHVRIDAHHEFAIDKVQTHKEVAYKQVNIESAANAPVPASPFK